MEQKLSILTEGEELMATETHDKRDAALHHLCIATFHTLTPQFSTFT